LRERDALVAQLEQRCSFTEAGTKRRDLGVQCGMIEKVVATDSFGSERREAVPPPIEGEHDDADLLLADPLLHLRGTSARRGVPRSVEHRREASRDIAARLHARASSSTPFL
jgi:hypothetical protein